MFRVGPDLEQWTCHDLMPPRVRIYAAWASQARGLFQPGAGWRRRGLQTPFDVDPCTGTGAKQPRRAPPLPGYLRAVASSRPDDCASPRANGYDPPAPHL